MSTRSCTSIRQSYDDLTLTLYRHCDGYPAEAGATLAEVLADNPTEELAVSRLLALTYDAKAWRDVEHLYHVHPGADQQGDLEHVYHAERHETGWTVTHYDRVSYSLNGEDFESWPKTTYTLPQFVVMVNADRAARNKRLATLRGQSSLYREAADYPMLATTETN